jgi:transposase-like protein
MWLSRETSQPFQKQVWRQPDPCPSCGRTMQLTKSTGGIADIRSYGCAECGLWTIEECRRTATAGERLPWDSMPA